MTPETAMILCPPSEGMSQTKRPMFGLTVGERLLLTLESAGVKRVAFAGPGERPACSRSKLAAATDGKPDRFLLVPADLVVDPKFLDTCCAARDTLPILVLPGSAWREVAADPDAWIGRMNSAAVVSGTAIRVRDATSAGLAERLLIRSLCKASDGVISRHLDRRISTALSVRLAALPVRPNHITVAVLLVGMLSVFPASRGTYSGFVLGAFCYYAAAVLDGCDGEIARLKFMGTRLGAWLDTVVDDLVGLAFIMGMYRGLAVRAMQPLWGWIGVWTVGFYLLTMLSRYYVMAFRCGSGDYQQLARATRPAGSTVLGRMFLWVRDVVVRTDFMPFSALVTAMLGLVPVFAVSFAVGATAACVESFIVVARYRKPQTRK